MPDRAVAFLAPGPTDDRQRRHILRFCDARGYTMTTRTDDMYAAARLIAEGFADVVVAATDPRNGVRQLVESAGGRFEVAREPVRRPPTLADWLRRALRRGVTPHHIARAVGETTTDVGQVMRDLGLYEGPDDDRK
jgi:hypothetical protein